LSFRDVDALRRELERLRRSRRVLMDLLWRQLEERRVERRALEAENARLRRRLRALSTRRRRESLPLR
jgi:ABC-type phosphate transport system auxiliary subunit